MVVVYDDLAPTPSCKDVVTALDDLGLAAVDPVVLDDGSTDNCGSLSFDASPDSFTCADSRAITDAGNDTDNDPHCSCYSDRTVQRDGRGFHIVNHGIFTFESSFASESFRGGTTKES